MIIFDEQMINALVETYLYSDIEGRNDEVYSQVEQLWNNLQDASCDYYNGEINRVLRLFSIISPTEYERDETGMPKKRTVRGVKSEDVAFIALHYGFLYGLLAAENARLNFWEWGFA